MICLGGASIRKETNSLGEQPSVLAKLVILNPGIK